MNSLYLYLPLRYLGRVKIGHTGDCNNRRKQLATALRSWVLGGGIWLLWASKVEKALHTIYAPLNTNRGALSKISVRIFGRRFQPFPPMPFHSGYDEYFWIVNPVTLFLASLFLWVQGATGWAVYLPVILLFFPLPFDLLICYALYWIAQVFIIAWLSPLVATASNLAALYLKLLFFDLLK